MKKESTPLADKVTLVTGAGGGIGREICSRFAELGSRVYMCDITDTSELARNINSATGSDLAIPLICDISSHEEIDRAHRMIEDRDKGIDILINNAAVQGPKGPKHFPEISPEGFRKTLDIDLSGAVYWLFKAIPHMKEQKWGRIMFSAAPLSSSGIPSPYLAGKAGFIGLAKHIAGEYEEFNIRTFALVLRHVDTPMIRRVIESRNMDVEEGIRKMNEKSLTGRMITAGEIAGLYSLFATAPDDCVKDLTLLSDGGITFLR